MKIAFIGQKGIPAHFGGIEFHVDELSKQLVKRGHQVTVYVRSWYTPRTMNSRDGVKLIHTPTIRTKHLDAAVHSLTSSLHSLVRDNDVVHFHAIGPSFFAWLPRLRGQRIVVTIHALDWQRPKWGRVAKMFLKMTERTAIHLSHSTIAVSRDLQRYFERRYRRPVHYIPNGVNINPPSPPRTIVEKCRLEGLGYILFLGRLVPEKRVDWLIRAFRQTSNSLRLVIAGGDDGSEDYVKQLRQLAGRDPRILFTGTVGGQMKEELLSNAFSFVTPSMMEGLPIALLEAMAHGRCVLASDIPAHAEIIDSGRNGLLFPWNDSEQLVASLRTLLAQDNNFRDALGIEARQVVEEEYSWESAVGATERLYYSLLADRRRG